MRPNSVRRLLSSGLPTPGQHTEPVLPLFSGLPEPEIRTVRPVPRRHPVVRQLWLGVSLPRLALETDTSNTTDEPAVVIDEGMVFCANAAAEVRGVCTGMSFNTAFALLPDLISRARDPQREQQLLNTLAQWAGRYTSVVSLEPPQALLLEIGGSLKLFGGIGMLLRRVSKGLDDLNITAERAIAPTPLGALWLARSGTGAIVTEPSQLPGALGTLPLAVTGWNEKTLEFLNGIGAGDLRDVIRLPRDGLARRLGRKCLAELDRAYGRQPDPRQIFEPKPRFCETLELPAETTDLKLLCEAVFLLIERLLEFLLQHQAGIQRLTFRLLHTDRPATVVHLGLFTASRDRDRFRQLTKARFERVALDAPVIAVVLQTGDALPAASTTAELFRTEGREAAQDAAPELVEKLRARLGSDAVCGFCLVPEHRPEAAFSMGSEHAPTRVRAGSEQTAMPPRQRPLWLLPEPIHLDSVSGRPVCEGELDFESGPERIESGWWDGAGVARDYYVVRRDDSVRLWIYRERRSKSWFLHGIF